MSASSSVDELIAATLDRAERKAPPRVTRASRKHRAGAPGTDGPGAPVPSEPSEIASPRSNAAEDARLTGLVKQGVASLLDRKAEKLVVLDLKGVTTVSDYFVIATATNQRQAQALSDGVEETLKAAGRRALSIEGYQKANWILLDYGDVVFHIFHEEARRFYGLERLWGDAPDATREFEDVETAVAGTAGAAGAAGSRARTKTL